MKTITRMILRRVASGNLNLTPQLLQILKELEYDQPGAGVPNHVGASVTPPNGAGHMASAGERIDGSRRRAGGFVAWDALPF